MEAAGIIAFAASPTTRCDENYLTYAVRIRAETVA